MDFRFQRPLDEEEAKGLQFPKRSRKKTFRKASNKEESHEDEHPNDIFQTIFTPFSKAPSKKDNNVLTISDMIVINDQLNILPGSSVMISHDVSSKKFIEKSTKKIR